MRIDWEDKFLFLCGFYCSYYWWIRVIRKEYLKGNISKKEALSFLRYEEKQTK